MPEQRRAALQCLLGMVPGVAITGDPSRQITGIEYNSTLIRPGDLFVAIPGDRFDGHDYLTDAIERSAVAVMVERPVTADAVALEARKIPDGDGDLPSGTADSRDDQEMAALQVRFFTERRRSERRVKAAKFPRDKSLRAFDFDANHNIDPAVVHTLAKCEG